MYLCNKHRIIKLNRIISLLAGLLFFSILLMISFLATGLRIADQLDAKSIEAEFATTAFNKCFLAHEKLEVYPQN